MNNNVHEMCVEEIERIIIVYIFYMSFSIDRSYLANFPSQYQTRSFAEDVDALEEKGDDLDWMLEALQTDKSKGISSKEEDIAKRIQIFGSNEKYVK